MSADDIRALDVPFHLSGSGRLATTGEDDHIRDMIFSVLFTSPGERVNRPDFGCGLKALLFSPASQAVAAATKVLVKASLQKWLQNEIEVEDVQVEVDRERDPRDRRLHEARRRRAHGHDAGGEPMTDVVTPVFADDERRADLVRGPVPPHVDLNGIDFVEVDPSDHTILRVSFLKPIPAGAYGVVADPTLAHIVGGTRIVGIKAIGCDDRVGFRLADRRDPGRRLLALRPVPSGRSRPRPGAPPHGVLVHGELPDRNRLPAGTVPAGGARRAAPRLPRQGLRELPPDARRPAPDAEPRLDGAQPLRPRHGPPGAARLHRRPPLLLPGRRRERGVPGHAFARGSRPAATRSSSTTGCTTAATPGPPSTSR